MRIWEHLRFNPPNPRSKGRCSARYESIGDRRGVGARQEGTSAVSACGGSSRRILVSRMIRVTFAGLDLEEFTVDKPASSVRLLLPSLGEQTLVVPAWHGNEFLLSDGQRPTIRTFTPRRVDPEALELDLDIVVHDSGAASEWVLTAAPGHRAAVSGPGRGYSNDSNASGFLLAGDETAIPAISQLLEALPDKTPVDVIIEVAHKDARLALPDHPDATVEWCDLPPGVPPGSALITPAKGFKYIKTPTRILHQGARSLGKSTAILPEIHGY